MGSWYNRVSSNDGHQPIEQLQSYLAPQPATDKVTPQIGIIDSPEAAMTIAYVLDCTLFNQQDLLVKPTSFDMLPLPLLMLACREHLARFRRGADNDPRFCLELFRRALDAQDHDAWRGLVDLYRPLLLARLQQRGVAPDLAEEAVQEAFVTLWLKSTTGAFSTCDHTLAQVLHYLWSGVRFALIKMRRQQYDVSLAPDSPLESEFASTGNETVVEQTLDARALLARIRKLVMAQEWEVLWLRFGQELPSREIAGRLSVPVEEVYLMLASAKRRLRSDPQLRRFVEVDGLV